MEVHDFFLTLLIILLTARVFAELLPPFVMKWYYRRYGAQV